ncbi:MAG TPA: MerR family transcriptional regulator [Gaiellaceae bacterium]
MSSVETGSLRIGEVAERLGLTTRTIRYYEELGLLGKDAERLKGHHRVYSDADVGRLRELVRLRDLLGLSLDEVAALAEAEEARSVLRDRWSGTESDAERLRIVDEATVLVRRQLALVEARRQTLDEFASELAARLDQLELRRKSLQPRSPKGAR